MFALGAGRVGGRFFGFDLSRNLPINNVAANVLELGYVHPYKANISS